MAINSNSIKIVGNGQREREKFLNVDIGNMIYKTDENLKEQTEYIISSPAELQTDENIINGNQKRVYDYFPTKNQQYEEYHSNKKEQRDRVKYYARENLCVQESPIQQTDNSVTESLKRYSARHLRHQTAESNDISDNPFQKILQKKQEQLQQNNAQFLGSQAIPRRSIPKPLHSQESKEYIRAQQNNLFVNHQSNYGDYMNVQQLNQRKQSQKNSQNQSLVKGQYSQEQQRSLKKYEIVSNEQSMSLLKKRSDNKEYYGYDFSSIMPDQHQQYVEDNSHYYQISINKGQSNMKFQVNKSNCYTVSENNSIIKAFQNYDKQQIQNLQQPSFINVQDEQSLELSPIKQDTQTIKNLQIKVPQSVIKEPVVFSPSNFAKDVEKSQTQQVHLNDETFIAASEADSQEQLGLIVKKTIENAKLGQIIHLPDCHFKVTDLLILKPITIKGLPGTIMEITHGSIIVDFQSEEKYKDVLVICECLILFSDRADHIIIKEELDKEEFIHSNLNSNRNIEGRYNSIQNNHSAQKQNSMIKYARTESPNSKAYLDINPITAHGSNLHNNERSSHRQNTMNNGELISHRDDIGNSIFHLFSIRNQTYVEIRDCCLVSKNKNSIMDAAFVMNEKDMNNQNFRGILSVKSCNIQNFSFGFLTGSNSILSIELSYIINCRQSAIFSLNPKIFKISGTILDQIECNGIEIMFSNNPQQLSQQVPKAEQIKKVFIEDNKIQGCKQSGIFIHQPQVHKEQEDPVINAIVKIQKNRIGNNRYSGITIKRVNITLIDILNCDISQNQYSNVQIIKTKIQQPEQFNISKCRISESLESGFVVKDSLSFVLSECEIVKNRMCGIGIYDSGAIQYIKNKRQTSIDQQINIKIINGNTQLFEINPTNMGTNKGNENAQESLGIEEDINRNIHNIARSNQGLLTSMQFESGKYENTSNNQPTFMNNQQNFIFNQITTQIQSNSQGIPLKQVQQLEKLAKQSTKVQVGNIKIIKCKIQDNKEHGINLEDIYQKTVEIIKCKVKDNFLNGICLAQDLETDEEILQSLYDNQQQQQTTNTTQNILQDRKILVIRKDIIQYSKVIINNCDIVLNKLHGVQMGYIRTTIIDSFIADNMQFCIKINSYTAKMLLRLIDSHLIDALSKDRMIMKGRIGGDWGEIVNVYKELHSKQVNQQSDLSKLLQDLKDEEENSQSNSIRLTTNSPSKKSTKLKCFAVASSEKRRIEKIGEYIIIKECVKGGSSKNLNSRNKQENNKSCGMFKSCLSPSNQKLISTHNNEEIKKKNGCLIF